MGKCQVLEAKDGIVELLLELPEVPLRVHESLERIGLYAFLVLASPVVFCSQTLCTLVRTQDCALERGDLVPTVETVQSIVAVV